MSANSTLLEIDKCISSRLWYTATAILSTENCNVININHHDIEHLKHLITTTLTASDTEELYEWISQKLVLQLDKYNFAKINEKLCIIQFHYNLKLINNIVPKKIKEGLLRLLEESLLDKDENTKCTNATLSRFLENSLQVNPALAHWLMNELSHSILQDVCKNTLKVLLKKESINRNSSLLLFILSKLNITESNEWLTGLYPCIIENCNHNDVELALYSKKNTKFLEEWHIFLDNINYRYANHVNQTNVDHLKKICNLIFSTDIKSLGKPRLHAKEIVLRVIKSNCHWLFDILKICSVLLKNQEYDKMCRILFCPLLNNLWPTLLLDFLVNLPDAQFTSTAETWQDNFSLCESLIFLSNKCCRSEYEDGEPILVNLNKILKSQVEVVKWILNIKRKVVPTITTTTLDQGHLSVKGIFDRFWNHCTLDVIKKCVNIHECDSGEITRLLQQDDKEAVRVFRAYRTLQFALKAILASKVDEKSASECFVELESLLNGLTPLSLRLELIENVYAMLFLRHDVHFDRVNDLEEADHTSIGIVLDKEQSHGFVCNTSSVKQLLAHLKRCLVQLGVDFAKQRRELSIASDELLQQQQLFRMDENLSDACWRLELLTNHEVKEDGDVDTLLIGEILNFSSRLKNESVFYNDFSVSGSDDDEQEKINSINEELEMSSEASSNDNAMNSRLDKKRNGKQNYASTPVIAERTLSRAGSPKLFNSRLIVNYMLAPKESLLLQCLWKADYGRAQQVIKTFNMKNTQWAANFAISKEMQIFRNEAAKQMDYSSHTGKSVACSTKELQIFERIRRAAQGGYQNSRLASQLETFLASQESNARLVGGDSNAAAIDVLAFCALDLGLTVAAQQNSTSSLLDVAAKYVRSSCQSKASRHLRHLEDVQRLVEGAKFEGSVPSLLCDATVPLRLQDWKETMDFWQTLSEKVKLFWGSQSLPPVNENVEAPAVHASTLLADIAKLCTNNQAYLSRIVAHLKILNSIVSEDEWSTLRTESLLLRHSLDSYFGRQIFDLNVEPECLEVVACNLGVNLVHNILVNCCPKLTCCDSLRIVGSGDMWGCIVLNKISTSNVAFEKKYQDPNQCVADILLELIQAIERLYPNRSRILNKDLYELAENSEIQEILSRTSLLESVDLSELSYGEQTAAFFLNLWNLLFLHTQLTIWVTEPPLNSLRYFISLSSVNYHVGDLGRISLAVLKSKLLSGMTLDSEYFLTTEDINEVVWQDLDLVHDPRFIFAMANEFHDTPAIRIYHPQTLDQELNEGLRDYVGCYAQKKFEITHLKNNLKQVKQIIHLPKIVESYMKCIENNITNVESKDSIDQQSRLITDYFRKSDETLIKYEPVVRAYEILVKYDKSDTNLNAVESSTKRWISVNDHSSTWSLRSTKTDILHYLEGHCWLLSYLVRRLHKEDSSESKRACDNLPRTACFDNITSSRCVLTLAAALFNDNPVLVALSENLSLNDLWVYFEKCLKDGRIQNCLDVINALPCKFLAKSTEIQCLKDKLLCQMINETKEVSNNERLLHFIHQIKDVNVLVQMIFANINKWPINLCQNALFHALHHKDKDKLPSHCKFKMNETLCRVTVFYKMLPSCKNDFSNSTWQDVLNYTEQTDPVCIVQALVDADKFELCLEWLEYQSFALEIPKKIVTEDLLIGLLKSDETDFKNARKLLTALPKRQSITLCKGALERLESIRAIKFIAKYLLKNCESQEAAVGYHKTRIGIEILDHLEPKDRSYYIHLINEPLLMLEQLLMNRKLKVLRVIITDIQKSNMLENSGISMESFDETVRFYAGKSLDFRVSVQRDGIDSKAAKDGGTALGGSLTTSSSDNEQIRIGEFTMPINVPTKEEWIPNEKARECDCCKTVIFSMFNRRHHCRRCGRVVCAACSQQRMQVLGYPVPVRICDDCKRQTVLQILQAAATQGTCSAASSVVSDCWRLTIDEAHNKSVREEFSFEHAPNVSMCLAIMSLHSDHKAYPSFLLDHCHEMKRLLQPDPGGRVNPEIDHALIIKMIRSLLIAVKMKCAKLSLNAGLAHCDRFLSQVDLIATLVQSDCLALIPTEDSLDEHALRKLRDLLTEKEQWQLALDVSTKAGLDTQGVWAAWGKAYLKAGHLDRARTKFSHCLEKVSHEYFDDWVMLSYPDSESRASEDSLDMQKQRKFEDSKLDQDSSPGGRKRQNIKSRPAKNSPLLVEILEILDNHSQSSAQPKVNTAQDILTTLNSLKAISQGQFSLVQNWNSRNIYYEESLYYLLTYASLASILEFYIKHEEYKKCLDFVLENNVEPEIFYNAVCVRCLNTGNIEKLVNAMRAEDSSLVAFKKLLIYACNSLDKKHFFHSLYHLQLLMHDHTRAAMSCIRFYTQDAADYVDLCSRSHFLVEAQKHLETELSSVDKLSRSKKSKRNINSTHSGSHGGLIMEMEPSEIDKHINTISRQLEVVKFLSRAEKEGRSVGPYLQHLFDIDTDNAHYSQLPSLFGNQQQKTRLAVLAILCGRDTEEGFGIAFRIMQDYNLRPQKVYSLAFTVLTLEKNIEWKRIEQLIKCMTSSGAPDSQSIADRVLSHCVKQLLHNPQAEIDSEFKDRVDCLIRLINDVELKINCYIESKQLKNAYLLVLSSYKQQRDQEKFIRKILKEAERIGQNAIRTICTKWLSQNSL